MDYEVNGVIFHHGIKGMKWGVRRFQDKDGDLTPAGKKRYANDVSEKKAAYKQAKKDYNKSFNKAYNRSIAAYSPIKKHRKANDERWEDAADKAERLNKAKADYKNAKTAKKQRQKELEEEYGKLEDQMTYGKKADAKKNAALTKRMNEIESEMKSLDGERKGLSDKQKKALKVGAAVAGTALAAYGAKKFHDYIRSENGKLAEEAGRKAMKEASNWSSITGLNSLSRDYLRSGNYDKHFELEDKISNIVVDYGLKTQRDMEKLRFDKAVANVYLNRRRG